MTNMDERYRAQFEANWRKKLRLGLEFALYLRVDVCMLHSRTQLFVPNVCLPAGLT